MRAGLLPPLLIFTLGFHFLTTPVAAQTRADASGRCPGVDVVSHSDTDVVVDKSFELDVTACRVTEPSLEAGMIVDLGSRGRQSGVDLAVGVGVAARVIDITLRGVAGAGRFRASLQRLHELLDRHAASRRAALEYHRSINGTSFGGASRAQRVRAEVP